MTCYLPLRRRRSVGASYLSSSDGMTTIDDLLLKLVTLRMCSFVVVDDDGGIANRYVVVEYLNYCCWWCCYRDDNLDEGVVLVDGRWKGVVVIIMGYWHCYREIKMYVGWCSGGYSRAVDLWRKM